MSGLAVLVDADADGLLALQYSDDFTVLHLLHLHYMDAEVIGKELEVATDDLHGNAEYLTGFWVELHKTLATTVWSISIKSDAVSVIDEADDGKVSFETIFQFLAEAFQVFPIEDGIEQNVHFVPVIADKGKADATLGGLAILGLNGYRKYG